MNGSVVLLQDTPKQKQIEQKTKHLLNVFYDGEPLTDFEVDV
jgi:hypothetical protein